MEWIPVKGGREVELWGAADERGSAGADDERHGGPATLERWRVHVHTTVDLKRVGEDHRR